MKLWRSIAVAMTVAAVYGCNEPQERIRPQLTNMVESVYASITVVPQDVYSAFPAASGILEDIYIAEGDFVQKGQTIARVSSTNAQINVDNARLNLELAQEQFSGNANSLENIKIEIASTQKQMILDSMNYIRQQRLWNQEIGSQSDLDNRRLQYELTQNKLLTLNRTYHQKLLDLNNKYKVSENALKQANTGNKDYIIKSKMDGRVYDLFKEAGEFITTQQPIALIGRSDSFVIEMVVDEADIASIALNQKVYVHLDAFKDTIYTAHVSRIYPLKDERTQTFKIEASFDAPPPILYAGLSGEANIVLAEKVAVTTIPISYLKDNKTVITEDGDRTVKVGMKNISTAEIISGIDTSVVLIKPF